MNDLFWPVIPLAGTISTGLHDYVERQLTAGHGTFTSKVEKVASPPPHRAHSSGEGGGVGIAHINFSVGGRC